ncbi:MAG: F0F1 ATP synthase subunit alpha [Oscillospiraceae bacterium]|nr:F0F1 ATP synthase subunit alpha [Oscillospiraceae bacterium]
MEIQYVLINFLLLVGILFLVARKLIIKIFRGRRERINMQLDEAELIENSTAPVFEEPVFDQLPFEESEELLQERAEAQAKIEQIQAFGQRECNEIHRNMIEKVRKQFSQLLKDEVKELFSKEPYLTRLRDKEAQRVEEILSMIKLTPGDMSYLHMHKVLYVTLTSAHPLEYDIIKRVDQATKDLLATVNGKTSLWIKEDPELIGGLRLRIGDTVYDATVAEELYHLEKRVNKEPVTTDEAGKELLEEFSKIAGSFEPKIHTYQLGRVMQLSDGICWMDGIADTMYGEVVEFECGESGMVLDIQPDRIGCVVFGSYEHIETGSRVRRLGRIASVPVGDSLLGRVVDAVGKPIDGEGHLYTREKRPIECQAPGILDRAPVSEPMHTGIKAIDALVPIGKGQRELIIGDRQTGKSAIAIDAIINQKGKGTICIYVAIGQKESTIAEIKERLQKYGAMEYTIIVAATASGSAATQYIAPFAGTAMAEYFMHNGRDVLIVYDDLSKHAVAYRELSLLLHRPSGREAYPGDIFYLHSRLLERSAHLSEEFGGGSITALPIIETLAGDISAYIPTNVISITDGQMFLESDLFHEGQRPAINVGLSVSRVGSAAQTKLMKQMAASLRTKLAQYRELADFTQLGSDIDETTRQALDAGARLMEALKQSRYQPLEDWQQALLLFAVSEGFADHVELTEMDRFEKGLYSFFTVQCPELTEKLKSGQKADGELIAFLKEAIGEYLKRV